MINITLQTKDFCQQTLYNQLRNPACAAANPNPSPSPSPNPNSGSDPKEASHTGAIVTFTGLVREFAGDQALTLEHYPAMTQAVLTTIAQQATTRWALQGATIVHRVGPLNPNEQIVFVGVASSHRQAAFEACHFMIDLLKTRAPFWKKEGKNWVEAKLSDQKAAKRWLEAQR